MADNNQNKKSAVGHYHPISIVMKQIIRIFDDMGFEVAEGPHIETEYYNFDALNIPADHPARDMWDTFWIKTQINADKNMQMDADNKTQINADKNPHESALLLRTHTSPVQVRYMEKNKPPIQIIAPGKAFRYEATDATHDAQFYQLEGLMITNNTTLATLKGVLKEFLEKFFEEKINIRFKPSYFPFVEPGLEVDTTCFKCAGKDKKCSVCKGSGWVEIMGAGMVHPKVLEISGINSRKWRGFAFGIGIDRLALLKYEIPDIRLFYNGDLRFVNQF